MFLSVYVSAQLGDMNRCVLKTQFVALSDLRSKVNYVVLTEGRREREWRHRCVILLQYPHLPTQEVDGRELPALQDLILDSNG